MQAILPLKIRTRLPGFLKHRINGTQYRVKAMQVFFTKRFGSRGGPRYYCTFVRLGEGRVSRVMRSDVFPAQHSASEIHADCYSTLGQRSPTPQELEIRRPLATSDPVSNLTIQRCSPL